MADFAILFEEDLPGFFINGNGKAEVFEMPAPGATLVPVRNIRTDQKWQVKVSWRIGDRMSCLIAGDWTVTVYLEQYGAREVAKDKSVVVPLVNTTVADQVAVLEFAPGEVPEGAYRLAVTVTLKSKQGCPAPVAGVGDSTLIQIYDPGKCSC